MFLSSFPKKYVGQSFEIDCVDIEVHGWSDYQPPIFKGSGVIQGDKSGRLTYKIYNQIPMNKENFTYIKAIKESKDPKEVNIRLFAKAYDGTDWVGGWSIPTVTLYQSPHLLISGEFNALDTRVNKLKGDKTVNCTELVFADRFDLPFTGAVNLKSFHEDEVISICRWMDHHNITFEDTTISFKLNSDKSRLHVEAYHSDLFTPPCVENWITEALIFMTAKVIQPRMVIRHFEEDAIIFIRATPRSIDSRMPPPFSSEPGNIEAFWQLFCTYLSKCKSMQQFELLELTRGFCELCLASTGTLQGFLISLSLYIEFCINQIFTEKNCGDEYKTKVNKLIDFVGTWEGDEEIRERAQKTLTMLNNPQINKRLDILIRQNVLTATHKRIWKKARPYLAHGKIIDFSREEEFWQYRNYLISMTYRLIFRIIGYKGLVLDYDGEKFQYIPFEWNDNDYETEKEEEGDE